MCNNNNNNNNNKNDILRCHTEALLKKAPISHFSRPRENGAQSCSFYKRKEQ